MQKRILEYEFISRRIEDPNDWDILTKQINKKIEEGYQPYGNPLSDRPYFDNTVVVSQALVKYET